MRRRTASLWAALASACAISALVSGCSTSSLTTDRPAPAPAVAAAPDMPPAVQREHDRILAAYGGEYRNDRLEGYVGATVDRLVAASEMPNLRYQVTILNAPSINAFALPTGNLYVTRGLIALANDTSELASVLSHEMAHVIARHAAIREDQARQAALVNRVANDLLADPNLGALALAKSKIAMANFSRAQEMEADGIGVGIAARAGYDAYGAQRFLTSMGANAALRARIANLDPNAPDFLSSHPATPERITNATLNARQFTGPGAGQKGREDYLAAVDGMTFGEDPSDGFVRGRRFLHPKLGFTFTAPDGFTLENTAQAVFGVKDGGAQAMRLDVVRAVADQSMTAYLKSGWIENIDADSVQAFTINGHAAATATARGDAWTFRLYAVRFGNDVYRFIFATRHHSEAVDRSFREALNSFRRMSASEARAARPQRIRFLTVQAGDSVERLASRMAPGPRQVERFRVLNGLGASDRVTPGEKVKIVVD